MLNHAISQWYVAEDSQPGDGFQVYLDCGNPRLQLASSSSAPRARRYGKEKVIDQLTFRTTCSTAKPAQPSLHEQCRYACKAEAPNALPRMAHNLCALRVECGRAVIVEDLQHPFVGYSYRPCLANVRNDISRPTKDGIAGERMRNEQD